MPGSARPRTPLWRWSSVARRCWSTPRLPNPTIRAGWRRRCARRWKAGVSPGSPAAFQNGFSPSPRARSSVSSAPDRTARPAGGSAPPRVLGVIFAVPLYDDNPTARTPVVTYFLIGLCTGTFLWQLGHNEREILFSYGMIPAELFGLWHPPRPYHVLAPWARIVTNIFL